jgi:hypothetical protein
MEKKTLFIVDPLVQPGQKNEWIPCYKARTNW